MLYKTTPETRLVYEDDSAFVGIGMTLRLHNQTDTVWLTDDDIVSESFQLVQSISESEELNLGGCISSELTFEFDSSVCTLGETDATFGKGCRIRLYRICTTDDSTTMTGIGYYFVDSITENEFVGTYKVVAYDILHAVMNMSLDTFVDTIWDSDYTSIFNDGTRWMQLGIFRQFLVQTIRTYCTDSQGEYLFDYEDYISVLDDSDYNLANDTEAICISAIDYSKTNAVELLRSIAELNCCFGYVNSWGRYDYIAYASSDFTTEQEMRILGEETLQIDQTEEESFCKSFSRENYKTSQIAGVIVCSENDELTGESGTVSDGSNYYKVQGNTVLTYSDSTTLYNMATALNDLMNEPSLNDKYYPSEVEIELRPYVEVGDRYYSLYNTIDDDGNTTLKRFYGLVAKIVMKSNLETLSIQGKDIRSNTETASQSANSTINTIYTMRKQISDVSDEVEEFADAEVVKHSDSYLYETTLLEDATDGTLLEKISSAWLHADYKGDIVTNTAKPYKNDDDEYVYVFRMAINKLYATSSSITSDELIIEENVDYGDSTIGIQRHIQFEGYVDIEVTCAYPNIFTVQEAVLNANSYQNEMFSRIGWYEMQTFSVGSGITAFKPTFRTTDTEEGGIALYVPVSETQARKLLTTEYTNTIKNIHLEIVSDDGGVFEFYESEVDDTDNPTQHRWKLSETAECERLNFEDCFEITSTSITNLSSVIVVISVLEDRQSGDDLLRIYYDTYEYTSTASLSFNLSMFAPVSLGAQGTTVTSTTETTDGEYDYTTIIDTPYYSYRFQNQEKNLCGNLPNLVKSQTLGATATRTTTTSTRISTGTEWVDIDTDMGGQPRSGTRSTTTLLTDATNTISKLVMEQDSDDEYTYNIDVSESDEEMYEMYCDLLEASTENYTDEYALHYFESGDSNTYSDTYIYLDVIGSFNDFTYTTEYYNGKLILVGYGNVMESFTGELVEGVFIGNGGTGLYVDIAGENLTLYKQYEEYQLEGVTYTIDFDDGVLTLTGSDESTSVTTIDIITYTIERTEDTYDLVLTDSDDNTQTVSIEPLWADDTDLTSSISEIFSDDIALDITEGNVILSGTETTVTITVENGTIGG